MVLLLSIRVLLSVLTRIELHALQDYGQLQLQSQCLDNLCEQKVCLGIRYCQCHQIQQLSHLVHRQLCNFTTIFRLVFPNIHVV